MMMKKLFSFLVIVMMTMTAWADDLTVVEVTTWEGIQNYLQDSNKGTKVCKLMADIDFGGGDFERWDMINRNGNPLFYSTVSDFTIDGNGHTIRNGKMNAQALLANIKNATVKNLTFEDIEYTYYYIYQDEQSHAIVAMKADGTCHFENLSFNNCKVTSAECGGVVCAEAKGNAIFTNITVTNCTARGGDSFKGGIVGKAETCTLTNCQVSDTNVQCSEIAGGLIGEAQTCVVSNCSFHGKVCAKVYVSTTVDANAGGIVAYCHENSTISNCQNNGEVEANGDRVGGIVGHAEGATITGCKNTGWIHHENLTGTDDEIGGILGYGDDTSISKCVNAGSIDGGDAYVGGIVGLLEGNSSVMHCVNGAFVNGDEEVGGIAGQIKDKSTVSYCVGASNRIEGNTNVQILVGAEPQGSTSNNYWISNTSDIDVGAVTETDLKSGKVTWHINNKLGASNALWTQNLEADAYPVIGNKGIHYARTMSNEWGTVVLPYNVTYSQSNGSYKLYNLNAANGGVLTVSEYADGTIPAATPMIVKKISGAGIDIAPTGTPNFSTTINNPAVGGLTFTGVYQTANVTAKSGYVFGGDTLYNIQATKGENNVYVAPYRAWLAGSTAITSIVVEDGQSLTADDITALANLILGGSWTETELLTYNNNGDDQLTVGDITLCIDKQSLPVILRAESSKPAPTSTWGGVEGVYGN